MLRRMILATTVVQLLVCVGLGAGEPVRFAGKDPMRYGGNQHLKASGDTIDIMGPTGSGAPYLGDFEAGWNGWTSRDLTRPTVNHWQVSDYNQSVAGNLAAWCGQLSFASCQDSIDPVGGYGNNWYEILSYRVAVADPGLPATVNIAADLQYDTEPAYDYVFLSVGREGVAGYHDLRDWNGQGSAAVNDSTTYLPAEFVDGSDIQVLFRFISDGAYSDQDCFFPTAGACRLDDVTVTVSQAGMPDIVNFTDFQDGTLGDWERPLPVGVGDFAALWRNLEDVDPCHLNYSRQVAFIDDGTVVPGTGGSLCNTWCYGPFGYVVNSTGGLAGPFEHLNNDVISPVMTWPDATADGVRLAFDVYRHEELTPDAPGIFYVWGIRSADTDNSAGNGVQILSEQPFANWGFFNPGVPAYLRNSWDVTSLVNPGRDEVQISLGVLEIGWQWGPAGNDATPAPYFDNVSLKAAPIVGPTLTVQRRHLAQDNFPESDEINYSDPGAMHVRFDMAANISPSAHLRNDPGDSVVVAIMASRDGAAIFGQPRLHYVIEANPLFDAYRTTPTSGSVAAISGPFADRWAFDLPDTGTLFPGDVMHYYIRAEDDLNGDIQAATLPADLAGFGDFSSPLAYDTDFVVRALPSLRDGHFGGFEAPPILFWQDAAGRFGDEEWFGAWHLSSQTLGLDYDVYTTRQPDSGLGNGLGGRTAGGAISLYEVMVYSSGDLDHYTLSAGDFNGDAGDDIGTLRTWLDAGNKRLFLTGDGLASDVLAQTDGTFLTEVMGVDVVAADLRPFIDNQIAPYVLTTVESPILFGNSTWIAYGGCDDVNAFDAVTVRDGAVRLAEFGDSDGAPLAYPYSAATLNAPGVNNLVLSLPYDLSYVMTVPGAKIAAPLAARVVLLSDVLQYFGYGLFYLPTTVPSNSGFAVANSPNPFNPSTSINYTIDRPGHLTLKIFNVRGQLVRTLIDQRVATGGQIAWDGTDDQGRHLASGVYFREARLGEQVEVGKMMLVK